MSSERKKDEFPLFTAHLGASSDGTNHLRNYPAVACSNCRDGITFEICQQEFDRLKARLHTTTEYKFPEVTRVEVIDENGRAYTNLSARDVKVVLQDDSRTLKVFIKKGAKTELDFSMQCSGKMKRDEK